MTVLLDVRQSVTKGCNLGIRTGWMEAEERGRPFAEVNSCLVEPGGEIDLRPVGWQRLDADSVSGVDIVLIAGCEGMRALPGGGEDHVRGNDGMIRSRGGTLTDKRGLTGDRKSVLCPIGKRLDIGGEIGLGIWHDSS